MDKIIRIGTRESRLALWQATTVQGLLKEKGFESELVPIRSEGDIDLTTPLYEMGVQGVFTRSLDVALLAGKIDIAVHSYKDVPTQLPNGIIEAAVLARGPVKDLLVYKGDWYAQQEYPPIIATSSIRRRAQWLHMYPGSEIRNLRGNVQTRLQKLAAEDWDGALFAQAGLERVESRPENSVELDWMLPAPAQGAILVACREDDATVQEACSLINHHETALCTGIERQFLRSLLGGCSTPISALAVMNKEQIFFQGNIFLPDGTQGCEIEKSLPLNSNKESGVELAEEILTLGARELVEKMKADAE